MKNDQSSKTSTSVMIIDEDESDVLLALLTNEKSDWILDDE